MFFHLLGMLLAGRRFYEVVVLLVVLALGVAFGYRIFRIVLAVCCWSIGLSRGGRCGIGRNLSNTI